MPGMLRFVPVPQALLALAVLAGLPLAYDLKGPLPQLFAFVLIFILLTFGLGWLLGPLFNRLPHRS